MRMKENLYEILSADNKTKEKIVEESTTLVDRPLEQTLSYQRAAIDKMQEEIKDLRQDRQQRKIFGYCIFGFMCAYMAAALAIVFFCGLGCMRLSDKVLITLLTTTLADVIGIFSFVAKYLYRNK